MAVPKYGWLERHGDLIKAGCNNSEDTWFLTCDEHGKWIGSFDGNCSNGKYTNAAAAICVPYVL